MPPSYAEYELAHRLGEGLTKRPILRGPFLLGLLDFYPGLFLFPPQEGDSDFCLGLFLFPHPGGQLEVLSRTRAARPGGGVFGVIGAVVVEHTGGGVLLVRMVGRI